jgi:hypothetical protein
MGYTRLARRASKRIPYSLGGLTDRIVISKSHRPSTVKLEKPSPYAFPTRPLEYGQFAAFDLVPASELRDEHPPGRPRP